MFITAGILEANIINRWLVLVVTDLTAAVVKRYIRGYYNSSCVRQVKR